MVAVNAEDRGCKRSKSLLHVPISAIPVVIGTDIAENHDSVISGEVHLSAEMLNFDWRSMNVASEVGHK